MNPAAPAAAAATPPGPPPLSGGALGWLRRSLFSTWYNALLTLGALTLLYRVASALIAWAWTGASFGPGPASCRGIPGACWAFIRDLWPLFMVGSYPAAQRWRAAAALLLVAALILLSLGRAVRAWRAFPLLWIVTLPAAFLLIRGAAWAGLPVVETTRWGGLLLTVLLTVVGIGVAFPFGVLLALGRRSSLPVIRALCVAYIELVRGVPLITLLFMASVMLPLFFPSGFTLDRLLRAQIGVILFSAAYLAEVVRGGLQGVPKGQEEAAAALGLGYRHRMGLVVLPQALRIVIPPLVGTFIALLKDTSLVYIVGLFDLLGMAAQAVAHPDWLGKIVEAYVFIGAIYFALCYSMSRYSRALEERFRAARR
jgi:general L-amino acid transport system permease protein